MTTLRKLPHVTGAARLCTARCMMRGPRAVDRRDSEGRRPDAAAEQTRCCAPEGRARWTSLRGPTTDPPGIILGSQAGADTGMMLDSSDPSDRRRKAK